MFKDIMQAVISILVLAGGIVLVTLGYKEGWAMITPVVAYWLALPQPPPTFKPPNP